MTVVIFAFFSAIVIVAICSLKLTVQEYGADALAIGDEFLESVHDLKIEYDLELQPARLRPVSGDFRRLAGHLPAIPASAFALKPLAANEDASEALGAMSFGYRAYAGGGKRMGAGRFSPRPASRVPRLAETGAFNCRTGIDRISYNSCFGAQLA